MTAIWALAGIFVGLFVGGGVIYAITLGRFDVQDRMLLAALLYQIAREWRDEGQFRPWKES